MIESIKSYLSKEIQLELHPDKIYLQHYSKGVKYLGAVIKQYRTYIAARTKGNFYTAIQKQNAVANDHKPTKSEQQEFIASMNSYLGIMKQYKTHNMRKKMLFKNLSAWWWNHVYLTGGISKFVLKRK